MPYEQVDFKGLYEKSLKLQIILLHLRGTACSTTPLTSTGPLIKPLEIGLLKKIVRKFLHLAPFTWL